MSIDMLAVSLFLHCQIFYVVFNLFAECQLSSVGLTVKSSCMVAVSFMTRL